MFGLDKLKDLRKNAEEARDRLDKIEVTGKAGTYVTVVCSGSRRVRSIQIDPQILRTSEPETIEKLIIEATNDALEQADKLMEAEMKSFLPNLPGMGIA